MMSRAPFYDDTHNMINFLSTGFLVFRFGLLARKTRPSRRAVFPCLPKYCY